MSSLLAVSRFVNRIVETSVFAMLCVMVVVVSAGVVFRYVLNTALVWSDELARYLLVWISFLGASMATYRGVHIGIAAFTALLPERFQRALGWIVDLLMLVFLVAILYQGLKILPVMAVRTAPTLGIRMSVFYTVLPIAAGVMILHVLAQSLAGFHRRGEME